MPTTLALAPSSAHRIHEIDTPLIPVTQVIASLGSQPTITVPMIAGAVPDVDVIWRYLTETAEFFDVPRPDRDALHAALDRFAGATAGRDRALIAATVGGAHSISRSDRGVIAPSKLADLVLWEAEHEGAFAWSYGLKPRLVWRGGSQVFA